MGARECVEVELVSCCRLIFKFDKKKSKISFLNLNCLLVGLITALLLVSAVVSCLSVEWTVDVEEFEDDPPQGRLKCTSRGPVSSR